MGFSTIFLLPLVGLASATLVIDVSHWQGRIDWAKVKAAGVSLAIAKATEGSSYKDDTFVYNWNGMKSNGIQPAAYHYFRGKESAAAQAQNLKQMLTQVKFGSNDMLVIDVEAGGNEGVSKETMASSLKQLLDSLRGQYSNIWIYTGYYYWESNVAWSIYDFSGHKLWIASYTKSSPKIPTTWKSKGYSLWQYTDKGRVNGISGNVDMSKF